MQPLQLFDAYLMVQQIKTIYNHVLAGIYPNILKIPTSFRRMCLKTLIFRFQFSISLSFVAQILLVG